nr:unnamed protein product [Spirometra erinaceieuropaei]
MVMLICLFLLSGLATASVVSQHLGKPTSDIDADKGNAPSMLAQPQTGGRYADADGGSQDSTYRVQSEPQNMAEGKNVETSYLSLSQSAGLMGDAALTDSDVESMQASDIGSELHSLRANEQTIGEIPESDLFGDWDQNVNKLAGSDDVTGQTVMQQQDYSSKKLAGEGQGPNGVKGTLLSSSKGLYAASASGDFVEILTKNILPAAWGEFAKKPSTYIDSLEEPYDYESIMHFKANEFTKPGENESIRPLQCCPPPEIGQRVKISEGDARQVNKLYKCPFECGYALNGEKGRFFVPKYESDRLPNDKCIWMIQFPVGFYAYIRFYGLQINQTQDCHYNYLEIFDGPSESSPPLYKLCGNDRPERLFSTGNAMIFRFVLNGPIARQGFLAEYTKKVDCGGYLKADKGTFTSPKYPNGSPPNQKCDWKIEVPIGFSVILLLHGSLNREKVICRYEYIELYDGPSRSSPLLRKLCGDDVPTTIGSTNNTMIVRFVSGRYPGRRALHGEFRKAACGGKLIADEDYITIPRYPSNRLPNNECTWNIEVPVGFRIALTWATSGVSACVTLVFIPSDSDKSVFNRNNVTPKATGHINI